MAKSSFKSLNALLKDADEKVKEAASEALNEASDEIVKQIRENMNAQGIRERTGALRGSIEIRKSTPKNLNALIKSEVFARRPKRPGWRNPKMKGRYKYGTPYGRILEFSPRINKPFFYTAWYKKRSTVKEEIINKIYGAWSKI